MRYYWHTGIIYNSWQMTNDDLTPFCKMVEKYKHHQINSLHISHILYNLNVHYLSSSGILRDKTIED